MGWWFGRILTFELIGDDVEPGLGAILQDSSGGIVASSVSESVVGYVAYGASRRAAIQPLIDHFAIPLFDDGRRLRTPVASTYVTDDDEAGCAADDGHARVERTQSAVSTMPRSLSLSYYDPARDYQTGQMRANAGAGVGIDEVVELPVVMGADQVKALAESHIARHWTERDRMTLRLPPDQIAIEPGTTVATRDGAAWRVEKVAIEQMAVRVDLSRLAERTASVAADPGIHLPARDVIAVPTEIAVLDLPDLGIGRHDVPVLHVAACQPVAEWRQVPLEVSVGGEILATVSARSEAIIGTALNILTDGQTADFDDLSFVEVELTDDQQWLESRDDNALANGANLAAIGSELIQFGRAVAIGMKRFRLEHLLRGRFGTEWATASHTIGDRFVLIGAGALQEIPLPRSALGSTVSIRARGLADGNAAPIAIVATGEAMRPPAPTNLQAAPSGDGGLLLSWVRRSRLGWSWPVGTEAPLGESIERYRITVQGSAGTLTFTTNVPDYAVAAQDLAGTTGAATVSVVQVGDFADSRPATVVISI